MNGTRTNHLTISTPEGISFSLLLAGPVSRFFAWSIDLACVSLISSLLSRFLFGLNIINADIAMAVLVLVYFLVSIGYGIVLEWYWRGQTLGKRLLRLRVVDEEGLRLRFHQVVIRNLLRFVDALPLFYLVGGISCALSQRSQRLGDIAAGTVVTRARSGALSKVDEIRTEKYNSFREYPHLVARLRQRATPELTLLALQAVERRENFEPTGRLELFKDFAEYFKSLVSFPEDAIFGLSDEQYVRNIIDSLFQKQRQKKDTQAALKNQASNRIGVRS